MEVPITHFGNLFLLLVIISIVELIVGGIVLGPDPLATFDPFKEYGVFCTISLYILRALTFITLPMTIVNLLGIIFLDTHGKLPKLQSSPMLSPFLCFRVVTRGLYPDLVKASVDENIEVCDKLGITNYLFEVVTDMPINLSASPKIREIVVPANYQTSKGSLYKARALNYCWEAHINQLDDSDWVVHLDEETILTQSAVIGALNFANESLYDFGQGVITYTHGDIVNWITTLSDTIRVGFDYGMIRFCLKVLHRPVFNWKGSFIVANAGSERAVGFDFGPEGSIAEDCYFGMTAWKEGYRFNFIDGVMLEKSAFTLADLVQQRKRWVQGISLTFWSRNIPCRCKLGLFFMVYSWVFMPFTTSNIILSIIFPIPVWQWVNIVCGVMGGTLLFLFIFGAMKSFNRRRVSFIRYIFLCISPIFVIPISVVMECIAVVWGLATIRSRDFHIVEKIPNKQSTKTPISRNKMLLPFGIKTLRPPRWV